MIIIVTVLYKLHTNMILNHMKIKVTDFNSAWNSNVDLCSRYLCVMSSRVFEVHAIGRAKREVLSILYKIHLPGTMLTPHKSEDVKPDK
jgi:hypothetical protein